MSGINNYFSNNNIFNGTEIPTQGKFDVGDIIVNIGENAEEEPMWMCIEAGEPGVWKVVGKVEEIDLSGYAEKGEIPVNVSELANDAGYLTEHQDLSGYATKEEMNGKVAQGDYNAKIAELEGRVEEAFTSANNGKQLIANAIGEPLSSDDTFSAMSTDINGLLGTFKTNMMNNGISVESSDKFKSLIDKIATMVEEGSGKGIQFAEGSGNWTLDGGSYASLSTTITTNLDFTPTYVFVYGNGNVGVSAGFGGNISVGVSNFIVSNLGTITTFNGALGSLSISDITSSSFVITTSNDAYFKMYATRWIAIGVGEDDSDNLRDSLASILENKGGISISEEDDMASLITKVDSILATLPKLVNGSTNDISLGSSAIRLFGYGGDGRTDQTVNISIPSKGGSNKYINGCKLVSCRLSMTGNGPRDVSTLKLTVTHKRGTTEIGKWNREFAGQTILTSGGWHLDLTDVQPGDNISV